MRTVAELHKHYTNYSVVGSKRRVALLARLRMLEAIFSVESFVGFFPPVAVATFS
jgi:hypothetical protein